jgi:DNA-binding transcriptional ArsR family regulator
VSDPRRGVASVDSVLEALADRTRRRLLQLLAFGGEVSATTLAKDMPVSRQAVAKHLSILEEAGLVVGNRAGREVLYTVRTDALDATARWMASLASEWDRRLDVIKRAAEAAQRESR